MFGHFHSPRTFFWPRTCCNCGRRRLPFLLPSLDKALGGGIAGGEGIAEISGPPGVGKTSLALQLAVSLAAGCAQSADCICLARERTVLPSATRTRHRDPTTSPSRARPANHQDSNTSVEEQSAGIDGGRHGLTCKRRRSSPAPAQIHDPRNSLCCGPRFLGKAASDLPDCRHRASEVSPAALPSSAMSARRRRRFPGSRRTLFIDSEGGVRSQRVLQVVAAHLGDNGAGYRAPTAQAVREEHRESLQTDADAPNEGWLGRMRGTFPGGSAQRCGLASETDGDSAFVLSCIDVARVFDHEELLSLLQHVLLAVMNVAEDSSDEKAFPPSGQLPKDKQDARSLEGSDHSRHYALIVVDSLSWIYHPAFFRSAADCTALLMQTVGILRFLSYKFGVAVVVTNQLTANWDSGGSVAAEHERFATAQKNPSSTSSKCFIPCLGPAWRHVPTLCLGLRWSPAAWDESFGRAHPPRDKPHDGRERRELVFFRTKTFQFGSPEPGGDQDSCGLAVTPSWTTFFYVDERGVQEAL